MTPIVLILATAPQCAPDMEACAVQWGATERNDQ